MSKDNFLSPEALTEAISNSFPEFWYAYADRNPEATRLMFSGAEGVTFGLPHPLFNLVLRTEPGLPQAQLATIRDQMNERGLPWFWFGIPSTVASSLSDGLNAIGLMDVAPMPAMAIDLTTASLDVPSPERLEIREVIDLATLEDFTDAILPAYEMPPLFGEFFTRAHATGGFYPDFPARIFYGVSDGQPVCGSMVFFTGRVAAIQCVGTVPEARGRGFGGAVVRACLRVAQDEGYRYAVLHATQMGFPVYEHLGFTTYCTQSLFMIPPPA